MTDATSSTIYHLGFDEDQARFIGFAYRSTCDFVSEELEYGTRLKPDPNDVSIRQMTIFPNDFIEIAEQQKLQDESNPLNQRVGAGGHLVAYTMQRTDRGNGEHQIVISIHRCHQFADFPVTYDLECAKLLPQR